MNSYEYSVQNKYLVNEKLTLRNVKEKEKEYSSLSFTLLAQKIIFANGKQNQWSKFFNFLIRSVSI